MYAKNLENLLAELSRRSDVSHFDVREFETRFDSLRRYGRLPAGRDNRGKPLTSTEIAAAVFGLTPIDPNWAGQAAILLADLRPVGGIAASFREAATLSVAVALLLSDPLVRSSLIRLELSVAEHATNSNGSATVIYQDRDVRRVASFVSSMAVSQLQPGAEAGFDRDFVDAPMARSISLNRRFFDKICSAIARSQATHASPAGDGSEYDAEDAQQARLKALGVMPDSRFLNIGVDTQVAWPPKETLVQFDRYRLVLMPKTAALTQSIHVDLTANCLDDSRAMTVVNRFLSMLAWCDDNFAVNDGGWSGNPIPVGVPRRNLAFVTTVHWVFDRSIPDSDHARRGLAHYREARNAETSGLVSYAVLSYFKIIELCYDDRPKATGWIKRTLPALRDASPDVLKAFMNACADEAPEDYIWSACRLAVAHASVKRPSDADDVDEVRRLHVASDVLRLLARVLISQELGVSER